MSSVRTFPTYYSPIGFQKLTVTSATAVKFTLPASPQCRAVIFTAEATTGGDKARFKVDTGTADATDGLLMFDGDVIEITNVDMINNFNVIALSGNFTLQIAYFGGGV